MALEQDWVLNMTASANNVFWLADISKTFSDRDAVGKIG
jgi:hypothetical protein